MNFNEYLIPVLFNFNSSTLRKAQAVPKSLRDDVEVKLFVVRDERLNDECGYRSSTSAHLNLYIINTDRLKQNAQIVQTVDLT